MANFLTNFLAKLDARLEHAEKVFQLAVVEFTGRPIPKLTDTEALIQVLQILDYARRTGKTLMELMFYEISLQKMIDDGRTKFLTRPMSLQPQP